MAGIDNNFSQFARAGNPWVSERDRIDMATAVPVRGGRQSAKPKPEFYEILISPELSEAQIEAAEIREARQFCISWMGGDRTTAPHPNGRARREGFQAFVKPPRDRELAPRVHSAKPQPIVTAEQQQALDKAKSRADQIAATRSSLAALEDAIVVARKRLAKLST